MLSDLKHIQSNINTKIHYSDTTLNTLHYCNTLIQVTQLQKKYIYIVTITCNLYKYSDHNLGCKVNKLYRLRTASIVAY